MCEMTACKYSYVDVQVVLASRVASILTPPRRQWTRLADGSRAEWSIERDSRTVMCSFARANYWRYRRFRSGLLRIRTNTQLVTWRLLVFRALANALLPSLRKLLHHCSFLLCSLKFRHPGISVTGSLVIMLCVV